ncbi:MAG: AI-2E family transporter [Spirochaetaceae bacterium]|jgi:predicted PurR-regulated permease PerM|nr:AI-2E family transporter [Spirochaetaceae bacterium]
MHKKSESKHNGRRIFLLIAFIACVLVGAVLKLTASMILPFTIAIFLAFVMNPMVSFLEKKGISRIFSIILVVCIIIVGLYVTGMVLYVSGRSIIRQYPKYENRLTEIYLWASSFMDLSYNENMTFFENLWSQLGVRNRIMSFTFSFSNSFISFLKNAFMVVLFLVFLLIEAAYLTEKIELAFERKWSGQIQKIGADLVRQVSRYLSAKFFISFATGVLVTGGLYIVGLEFAVVWGIIQFILNFIPNIGSIAAGGGAVLFAVLQFWPQPGPIIAVGAVMLAVNMVIGNILEPKIMGDNLGISPIMILISLMLWGWIWGFVGMILAVPMTVIVKILCENIPFLEPLSILLGSKKATLSKRLEQESLKLLD